MHAPDNIPHLTQPDLLTGFRLMGITDGTALMAHSALSAFGWVEGGAETVIRALLETVGEEGTVCMPALCQRDVGRRFETWDIRTSPSDVGRITETFRHWPGVTRSDHPTHSVCALGPLAGEITAGHATAHGRPGPWGPAAFGHGSPWEKLYELDVLYCFLGVNFRVNTMRHLCQSLLVEEHLLALPQEIRGASEEELAGWNQPGVWPHYPHCDGGGMEARLAGQGLITYVEIGAATCRSITARTLVDSILSMLRADPADWFDSAFLEWWNGGE